MRVWDQVPPENLCDQHLLGEHREVHCIWTVLMRSKKRSLTAGTAGYMNHPEVRRWRGHMCALRKRHNQLAREMRCRGMEHKSPLPFAKMAKDSSKTPPPWDDQKRVLVRKGCDCEVPV